MEYQIFLNALDLYGKMMIAGVVCAFIWLAFFTFPKW